MKRLITKFLGMSLVLVMATATMAQTAGPKTGGQKQGGQKQVGQQGMGAARMKRSAEVRKQVLSKLNLNKDQQAKMQALDTKTEKALKALMAKNKPGEKPAPEMREKFQALMKEHREGMDKILTDAQQKKFRDLMKARRDEMRKKRQDRPKP